MLTSLDELAPTEAPRAHAHPSLRRRGRAAWLAAGAAAITLSAFGATAGTALAAQRRTEASKAHAHAAKAANRAAVEVASVSKYGKIFVDQKGLALYYDTAVKPPKKWPCKGACLTVWHPLVLPKGQAKPVAGKAVTGLGVVRGPSGPQVAWHGKPLYTFARDHKGTVYGQGFVQDGTWYVARSAVSVTTTKKGTTGTAKSSGGSSW